MSLKPGEMKPPIFLVSSKHPTHPPLRHSCFLILRHSEGHFCTQNPYHHHQHGQCFCNYPWRVLQFPTEHSIKLFSHPRYRFRQCTSNSWKPSFWKPQNQGYLLKMNMQHCAHMSRLLLWQLTEDKCHWHLHIALT